MDNLPSEIKLIILNLVSWEDLIREDIQKQYPN